MPSNIGGSLRIERVGYVLTTDGAPSQPTLYEIDDRTKCHQRDIFAHELGHHWSGFGAPTIHNHMARKGQRSTAAICLSSGKMTTKLSSSW